MTAPISHWKPEDKESFGHQMVDLRHTLCDRPMFSDDGLIDVLDRYPRDRLGVFTMGHDLTDTASWRRGAAEGMSGDQLLQAVKAGRFWLNLRDTDKYLPEFAALMTEIIADKQAHLGVRILKPDLGLLISSPRAEVFYHLDVPCSSLWQIRGEKTFRLYPRCSPYVSDQEIERFVLREGEGQFDFDPRWDDDAQVFHMTPGVMLTWPQNAPHRVSNGDMLNVSLSMEFMTPKALLRANLLYANGLLRRRFGLSPVLQERISPVALAKLLFARAAKAREAYRRRTYTPILKPSFKVEV